MNRRRGPPPWLWPALALVAVLTVIVLWAVLRKPRVAVVQTAPPPPVVRVRLKPTLPWQDLRSPTDRKLAPMEDLAATFQPTAAGRTESGMYGSVRTSERGGRVMSSFHEGIDIAPAGRDRKGEPTDKVAAVMSGTVAYANRVAGNSNYGKYVVLLHRDPIGEVYSLYAHLAEIEPSVQPGLRVSPGTVLGVMGHTSSVGIPSDRGHVHLEMGLVNNSQFASWYRGQKLVPDHGMYHGQNFLGVDPLSFFLAQYADPAIHFGRFLASLPVAFEVVLRAEKPLDFFQRYDALWHGPQSGGAMVIACTENGLPVSGRPATEEESAALGKSSALVQNASTEALGRNGCHLVTREGASYSVTSSGRRWLEVLTYGSGWTGARIPTAPTARRTAGSRRR
jgi:murein DD-endopeptidase MepM/ murein hydrolase activator NlpD